jgi:hypothetical protein
MYDNESKFDHNWMSVNLVSNIGRYFMINKPVFSLDAIYKVFCKKLLAILK